MGNFCPKLGGGVTQYGEDESQDGPILLDGHPLPLTITESGTVKVTGGKLPVVVKYVAIGGGGGGGGGRGGCGGGSGFIWTGEVELREEELHVKIGLGGGGGEVGGQTSLLSIKAAGGKASSRVGAGGSGWSGGGGGGGYDGNNGGGDGGYDGNNGEKGDGRSGGRGQGTHLPPVRSDRGKLVAGSPGRAREDDGGGGGGIVWDMEKLEEWKKNDGEGYGAGAGGYSGVGNSGVIILAELT